MKALPSFQRVQSLLDYDPSTGSFRWLVHRSSTARSGSVAGKIRRTRGGRSYLRIQIDGEWYSAHRLAFLYMTGSCPDVVDHGDGDGLNNAWANLRDAGLIGNAQNAKRRVDNTSGVKNVSWCKQANCWQVGVTANGVTRRKNLRTLAEAEETARKMREELHGDFARAA